MKDHSQTIVFPGNNVESLAEANALLSAVSEDARKASNTEDKRDQNRSRLAGREHQFSTGRREVTMTVTSLGASCPCGGMVARKRSLP
ncbi:hypothetical protein [Enterobacter hormaechei]|uniref:hypothetical protein n=1 Tax=Enterobacter hormaechei TaxID=158836 RepID=UPI00254F2952|nr:hypothetical protein [Enterobacter hormaechei]MEC6096367.1 hypothetical protein [Enterobacter hormaechei]